MGDVVKPYLRAVMHRVQAWAVGDEPPPPKSEDALKFGILGTDAVV